MKCRLVMRIPICTLIAMLALVICWPVYVSAQEAAQSGQTGTSGQPAVAPDQQADNSKAPQSTTNQAVPPDDARQAQYIADSQKLYQLAQELKVEVAKSNKNTLSIAVTKKAEEIEKLARSLKERMRKE